MLRSFFIFCFILVVLKLQSQPGHGRITVMVYDKNGTKVIFNDTIKNGYKFFTKKGIKRNRNKSYLIHSGNGDTSVYGMLSFQRPVDKLIIKKGFKKMSVLLVAQPRYYGASLYIDSLIFDQGKYELDCRNHKEGDYVFCTTCSKISIRPKSEKIFPHSKLKRRLLYNKKVMDGDSLLFRDKNFEKAKAVYEDAQFLTYKNDKIVLSKKWDEIKFKIGFAEHWIQKEKSESLSKQYSEIKKRNTDTINHNCFSCLYYKNELINYTDSSGYRQGKWVYFYYDRKNTSVKETGIYNNNLREGVWQYYLEDSTLCTELNFSKGKAIGKYSRMGYADGKYSWMGYKVQLLETGQFENGLREGKVTEFYNGCVFIEYNFHKGIDTSRTYHLYHSIDSGRCVKKQSIMNFDFKNKKELLQFFDTSGKELKRAEMELKYGHMPNDPKNTQGNWYQYLSYVYRDTVPESRIKNCDGKSELKFIKNGMIHIQKGEFRNCNFINGDIWIYDKNGLLLKIMVYKDGKYVGDKMLPENEKK